MLKRIYQHLHRHYHLRYHGIYRHAKQLFILDILLLSMATVLFVSSLFFFFWKPKIVDQIAIDVNLRSLTSSSTIRSGDMVDIVITHTNNSSQTLESPALALQLPQGFVLSSSSPPISNQSIIALPVLGPNDSSVVHVYGHLWSEPNREDKLTTILSYHTKEKNQTEQKVHTFFFTTPNSVLKSELNITTSSFPGSSLPFRLILTNTDTTTLSNIRLHSPNGLSVVSDYELGDTFTLQPGKKKMITGSIVAPEKPGDYTLDFTSDITINNTPITQTHSNQTLRIQYPRIEATVELNKALPFADVDMTIPLKIKVKNDSDFEATNLQLELNITPAGVVDLEKTARENGLKIKNNTLVIDSSKRTAFAKHTPHSEDVFPMDIFLLPHFSVPNQEQVSLAIKPTLRGNAALSTKQTFEQTDDSLAIPLATEINLNTEVRYFTIDGEQVGRGPLPPQVGETTKYGIFVTIHNTTNELTRANLAILLAPGVTFTGKQSSSFGEQLVNKDGAVQWHNSTVPANSMVNIFFEIAVSPTTEQKGKLIPIVDKTIFEAEDRFTHKNFHLETPSTTNQLLKSDKGSKQSPFVVGN